MWYPEQQVCVYLLNDSKEKMYFERLFLLSFTNAHGAKR